MCQRLKPVHQIMHWSKLSRIFCRSDCVATTETSAIANNGMQITTVETMMRDIVNKPRRWAIDRYVSALKLAQYKGRQKLSQTVGPTPLAAFLTALLALPVLHGCSSIGYLSHVASGQTQLLLKRRSVDRVLADAKTAAALKERLRFSRSVLDFAEREIGLAGGRRYRRYVDLGREHVVWSVVAAPEFALSPAQTCFPIVGCVPYLGYFNEAKAQTQAARYQAQDLEVYVGGVAAYSTLGWFADPLLNTFIDWPDPYLASLLIHELSHSKVWIKGDVALNEAFASFVGEEGARQMLANSQPQDWQRYQQAQQRSQVFRQLTDELRVALTEIYMSDAKSGRKREQKAAAFADFRACYERRKADFQGRYDELVASRLNNAYLAASATYDRWQPSFAALFRQASGDWSVFFEQVEVLGSLAPEQRSEELQRLRELGLAQQRSGEEPIAAAGDAQHADEIQCEALTRHTPSTETLGGKDDQVGRGRHR